MRKCAVSALRQSWRGSGPTAYAGSEKTRAAQANLRNISFLQTKKRTKDRALFIISTSTQERLLRRMCFHLLQRFVVDRVDLALTLAAARCMLATVRRNCDYPDSLGRIGLDHGQAGAAQIDLGR